MGFLHIKYILQLLVAILIPNLGGLLVVAVIHGQKLNVFDEIVTPSWIPPAWLYPCMWSVLYCVIGCSSFIVFNERHVEDKYSVFRCKSWLNHLLSQFTFELVMAVNFFGTKSIIWALVDIIVVDVTAVATAIMFWKVKPSAAYLFIPYIIWITFVTVLNCSLVALN